MERKSKLMIYVQADLAPDVIRWAIRLGLRTSRFCNDCIGHSIQNMERGLIEGLYKRPSSWDLVNTWLLRQGKAIETSLPSTSLRRSQAQQQAEYRQVQPKLKNFEKELLEGTANTRIVFQVHEGSETGKQADRWPTKLRRMAEYFQIKPNDLVNRMIVAGITALEREDALYEPDFVSSYQREIVLPRAEQLRSERLLAAQFDTHADVPPELLSDGWAFMALNETANLHYRELADGFLNGRSEEEVLKFVSLESLSRKYLERLKEIYRNPSFQDWGEEHPLRSQKLKKEIIDAWVDEWTRSKGLSEKGASDFEEIKSQLSGLNKAELEMIRREVNALLISRES